MKLAWDKTSRVPHLIAATIIIAGLYFAKEVLLPIALAALVTFLLAPLTIRMQRWGLHRVAASLLTVALALTLVGGAGWLILHQAVILAENLPTYEDNLKDKIHFLRGPLGSTLDRASETVAELSEEITKNVQGRNPFVESTADTSGASPGDDSAGQDAPPGSEPVRKAAAVFPLVVLESRPPVPPVPESEREDRGEEDEADAEEDAVAVKLVASPPATWGEIFGWMRPILAPLGTFGLVVVFVLFMLIFREDIRDRMIRLSGEGQVFLTTQALNEAAQRVSRVLRMQLLINSAYGVSVGLGLSAIGVPNAWLAGVLAGICRFLPFVGPWIAALLPITLSLAVFEGWSQPLLTIALFLTLELLVNNVAEPYLYGSSIGVSAFGIIICVVFWTWLWGFAGLLLAMPLTVCLTVLARYVPPLKFLNILLSDEPALPLGTRFYQRLLAADSEEAEFIAEEYLRNHSEAELYDAVLLPALFHCETDRHAGRLTDAQGEVVVQTMEDLVEELPADVCEDALAESSKKRKVMCVAARDQADVVAGRLLSQLLCRKKVECEVASRDLLVSELVQQIGETGVEAVVISALPPQVSRHARYLCKRIHQAYPQLPIIVGLWSSGGNLTRTSERLSASGAKRIVYRLTDAADTVEAALRSTRPAEPQPVAT